MRKIALFVSSFAALFLVISCASTPPEKPQPEAPIETEQPQPAEPGPEPAPEATQPAQEPAQPAPEPSLEATQPEKPAIAAPDAELAQAKSLQAKIDSNGLAAYDPENYEAGSRDLKAGEDAYGADNAAAKKSLDAAIGEFNAVIEKGEPLLVAQVQDQSEASKKAADDLMASVAVKDEYAKAEALYQLAIQEKNAGDLENARRDFSEAQKLFAAVAATAQQKKDAAIQSIQAAQQDLASSEQKIADALRTLQEEGVTVSGGGQ